MVGLMRVGYGFSTGQQGNKSIDYFRYCDKCLGHGCYSVLQGFMSARSIGRDGCLVRYSMLHCQVDMYVQLAYMQQLDVSGPLGVSWVVFSSWHGL
jgi:hypothetical protein